MFVVLDGVKNEWTVVRADKDTVEIGDVGIIASFSENQGFVILSAIRLNKTDEVLM